MALVRCVVAAGKTGGETCREGEVGIAVDVLRASTTIITALDLGAREVLVTPDVDIALAWAGAHRALLMGERGNVIVPGFDLGNSPVALRERAGLLKGRTVVFTSSNFPRAAAGCAAASRAFVGCLINLGAVCEHAAAASGEGTGAGCAPRDVCLVLAGNLETSSEEDLAFAGACAIRLAAMGFEPDRSVVPAMEMVEARGAGACVEASPHAAALVRQGFAEDVALAARTDLTRTVGVLEGEGIRAV